MKIVLCIPGYTFRREVVIDIILFLEESRKMGWDVTLKCKYLPNVYKVRDDLLEGIPQLGKEQKPFNGKIDYDYVLWIDSDIRFNTKMIETLLSHKKDVITGLYKMVNDKYAMIEKDYDNVTRKPLINQYFDDKELQKKMDENNMGIFPILSCGLGICLMSRKALESIEYPWFIPVYSREDNSCIQFSGEDAGICIRLRDAGFTIYCDPNIIAGHMKMTMI